MASIVMCMPVSFSPQALCEAVSRCCPGATLITDAMVSVVDRGPEGPTFSPPKRMAPLLRVPIGAGRWFQGQFHGRGLVLACRSPVTESDVAPLLAALREIPGMDMIVAGLGAAGSQPPAAPGPDRS